MKFFHCLTSLFNLLLILAGILNYVLLAIDPKNNKVNVSKKESLFVYKMKGSNGKGGKVRHDNANPDQWADALRPPCRQSHPAAKKKKKLAAASSILHYESRHEK